jgi:hypothetical protein
VGMMGGGEGGGGLSAHFGCVVLSMIEWVDLVYLLGAGCRSNWLNGVSTYPHHAAVQ